MSETVSELLVLYDASCRFCIRCREWLEGQELAVPLSFMPAHSGDARRLAGHLPLGQELVVLGPNGEAWVGDAAFAMCLWATRRYRGLASSVAAGDLMARLALRVVASRRTAASVSGTAICSGDRCGTSLAGA